MDQNKIANTLAAHQGSWDSWGWHCSCGAKEALSDMPVVEGARPGKGPEARAALLAHQASEIARAA